MELDEDDLEAALILMRSASNPAAENDENLDPESSDVFSKDSRKRRPLPWVLVQRFEGLHAKEDTRVDRLPQLVGRGWEDASERTSQRCSITENGPGPSDPAVVCSY